MDPRCGPHPIACFLEALTLKHPTFPGPKSYVYATGWGQDGPILTPFRQFYERYRNDGRWAVHAAATGHDVMVDDPERLARLLLALA